MLEYVEDGTVGDDELVVRIAQGVKEANADAKWREHAMGLMTMEMDYTTQINAARREAFAIYSSLIERLLNEGRIEDLERATSDSNYREELFLEFGLKD